MFSFEALKKAFGNWPSELDVAKEPSNWTGLAESFFFSAITLNNDFEAAAKDLEGNVGKSVDVSILQRRKVGPASIFCLAFSLELITKAALINQGIANGLESGGRLPFLSHNVLKNAESVKELNLTDNEKDWLLKASDIIANGKYPTGTKPMDDKNGVKLQVNFSDFFVGVDSLYGRLRNIAVKFYAC